MRFGYEFPYQLAVAIILVMVVLVAAGCVLRIDNVIPDQGDPYQKVFLLHSWRME